MILTVRYFATHIDVAHHKILREHIFNIGIYLSYRINIPCHANFARIPLTNPAP